MISKAKIEKISGFIVFLIILPSSEGGRYSEMDKSLVKLVAPLMIVAVILVTMLILLLVLLKRKNRPMCMCICCREVFSKHKRMVYSRENINFPCAPSNNINVTSDQICDICSRCQSSSKSWATPKASMEDIKNMTEHCSTQMNPILKICRCTLDNNCGSPSCRMAEAAFNNAKKSGLVLSLMRFSGESSGTEESALMREGIVDNIKETPSACQCTTSNQVDTECMCACVRNKVEPIDTQVIVTSSFSEDTQMSV